VDWLVILDTNPPVRTPALRRRARARAQALQADAPTSAIRRTAVVVARGARFAARSAYAHAERRLALTSAGWLPRRGYRQYDLFLRLNSRMSREYTPSGTFDGSTLVVRGSISDGVIPRDDAPPPRAGRALADLGWSKLVTGPVVTTEVPADHLSLLRKPAVALVGAQVSETLA
jgi:thioesterase domain-containing protein